MRILIATGIFPPDIGGPATMLSHLARSLKERGFEVEILTYAKNEENTDGVSRVKKNNKLKYFWRMWKMARGVNLIYTTDTYSVGYFAYLIKKITNRKYILRFTGDSAWETARAKGWTEDYIVDFQNKKYDSRIEKLKVRRNKILLNADKIIVDCEFNKKLAEIIGVPTEKIEVIPNAVDFENNNSFLCHSGEGRNPGADDSGSRVKPGMTNQIRQEFSPHGEKIILTACRLTPWKGVDKILEILPELKQKNGAFKFLIMGEGSESEKLKMKSEKLNLENQVYFLGKVLHAETYNYLKAADVFILNSQYEGTSHALLDAMSAGIPILAANVGGNPELIENGVNGFLFEYNNKKEILENLEKVLVDAELRKKFILSAQEKVKKFSWEGVVEKTEEIIKNIK